MEAIKVDACARDHHILDSFADVEDQDDVIETSASAKIPDLISEASTQPIAAAEEHLSSSGIEAPRSTDEWSDGYLGTTPVKLRAAAAGLEVRTAAGEEQSSYPYDQLRSWWDDAGGFVLQLESGEEVQFCADSGRSICAEMKRRAMVRADELDRVVQRSAETIQPSMLELTDSEWLDARCTSTGSSEPVRLRAGALGLDLGFTGQPETTLQYEQMVSWYDGPSRLQVSMTGGAEHRFSVDKANLLCRRMKAKASQLHARDSKDVEDELE